MLAAVEGCRSPRQRLPVLEETAGRTRVVQDSRPDDASSALVHWATARDIHIRGDSPWRDCIHENARVTEFSREGAGQRIKSSLGYLVRRGAGSHLRQRSYL